MYQNTKHIPTISMDIILGHRPVSHVHNYMITLIQRKKTIVSLMISY